MVQTGRLLQAVLLQLLLLLLPPALTRAGTCPDASLITHPPQMCQAWKKVCVDQNVFVLYENQHNPRHELFTHIPKVQLNKITTDYYGFGDVWATQFERPAPHVRPATGGEETRELAHPQFSRCSLPLVVYASQLYKYGDFFANTVTSIHMMQQDGALDRRWVGLSS